ncbi:hypothetical protein GCM10027074_31000 [Streptomyces deserti]
MRGRGGRGGAGAGQVSGRHGTDSPRACARRGLPLRLVPPPKSARPPRTAGAAARTAKHPGTAGAAAPDRPAHPTAPA